MAHLDLLLVYIRISYSRSVWCSVCLNIKLLHLFFIYGEKESTIVCVCGTIKKISQCGIVLCCAVQCCVVLCCVRSFN